MTRKVRSRRGGAVDAKKTKKAPRAPRHRGRKALAEDLVSLAGRTIDRALALGADAAEAFVLRTRTTSLGLEGGRVATAERREQGGVGVRLVRDGAVAFAHFTDEGDAAPALRGALEAAAHLPRPAAFALPPRRAVPAVARLHDRRVATWTPAEGHAAARDLLDAAKAAARGVVVAGGGVTWEESETALASSEGFRGAWRGTQVGASAHAVLRDGAAASTGFEFAVSRRLDVDFAAVGREAARLAKAGRRPRRAPPGAQTVVLRPTALEGLFEQLVVGALSGDAHRAGRSVWAGKVGEAVLDPRLSIVEDGRRPGAANAAPFDDEGTPSRRVPLVERGVLRALLDDAAGAAAGGGKPTASALRADRMGSERSYRAPPRATGRALALEGRGRPLEDLVADVRRGLVVHDALGAHTANPASGDFSVGANTCFRVEDGEIVGPASPVMLGGNLPRALAAARLGNDPRECAGSFSPAAFRLPSVRLDGIVVTS